LRSYSLPKGPWTSSLSVAESSPDNYLRFSLQILEISGAVAQGPAQFE
jgi:hypothetical protein